MNNESAGSLAPLLLHLQPPGCCMFLITAMWRRIMHRQNQRHIWQRGYKSSPPIVGIKLLQMDNSRPEAAATREERKKLWNVPRIPDSPPRSEADFRRACQLPYSGGK